MFRLVTLCALLCGLAFAANYEVINGIGNSDDSFSMLTVYPRLPSTTITICEGDSIIFKVQSELHSVTFPASQAASLFSGNPYADPDYVWVNPLALPYSNGAPVPPDPDTLQLDVYAGSQEVADGGNSSLPSSCGLMLPKIFGGYWCNVTFHDPGRYTYSDIAHGNGGIVVVVPQANCAGDSSILTPAEVADAVSTQIADDLATTPGIFATNDLGYAQSKSDSRSWDDVNERWVITAGFVGSNLYAAYQRFMPEDIIVELGDSVLLINQFAGHVHTFNINATETPAVTFNYDPTHVPPTLRLLRVAFVPDPSVLARLNSINQKLPAYTGVLVPGASQVGTFTEAGFYHLTCEMHSSIGMKGSITVVDTCAQCYSSCQHLYDLCRASLVPGTIPDASYQCTAAEIKAAEKCKDTDPLPPRGATTSSSAASMLGAVAAAVVAVAALAL